MPKILTPDEVNALQRCAPPGPGHGRGHAPRRAPALRGARLRFDDLRPGENQVFVADGKGGHQRLVPISPRFFRTVSVYMETERPKESKPISCSWP